MRRLLFWRIAIPLILALIVSTGLVKYVLEPRLTESYTQSSLPNYLITARTIARSVSLQLQNSCSNQTISDLEKNFSETGQFSIYLTIPNCGQDNLASIDLNQFDNQPDTKNAISGLEISKTNSLNNSTLKSMEIVIPIYLDNQIIGALRLITSTQPIPYLLAQLINNIYLALIALIFLVIVLAWIISSLYSPQINKIADEIRAIVENQKEEITVYDRKDEIGYLSRTVHQVSINLKDRMKKYVADRNTFTTILTNMNDGILIVDEAGTVQLINRAASQMFTVEENSAINHSLVEILRNHEIEELWLNCQSKKQQLSINVEIALNHIHIRVIASPLEPQLPGSTLFLFQDLTRISQLEIIRRDFVSNVSHELRTPLTSLKILTETLYESAWEDPAVAKNFLEKMDAEIDNLIQMVQELLELSRIESGKVPLQKTATMPCDLIKRAVDRMQMQIERGKLLVHVECQADLPSLEIDSARMEQVLVNLIHNSIKFTPPAGSIIISAMRADSSIIFAVKDTGIGIPPRDLERIFERFYKVDRSRSNLGTGLGLSIARHLVEAHGGKIWAESIQTQGSTFYFSIPIQSL